MPVPADGPGDYRGLIRSLERFQGTPRRLIFPLHAWAVRRLLLLPVPEHEVLLPVPEHEEPGVAVVCAESSCTVA